MGDRKEHLKHLIFNDALLMHDNCMNHNASDRASMYETWLEDMRSPHYNDRYRAAKTRYDKHKSLDVKALSVVTGYEVQEDTLKEIEEYAEGVVERAYSMLEKKLEKMNGSVHS